VAADLRVDESQTVLQPLEPSSFGDLVAWFRQTAERVTAQLREDGIARSKIRLVGGADCRYLGQGFELQVLLRGLNKAGIGKLAEDFNELHRRVYGHVAPDEAIELVTLRLSGFGALARPDPLPIRAGGREAVKDAVVGRRDVLLPGSRRRRRLPLIAREVLRARNVLAGPAIIEEMDSTTLILPGQEAQVDRYGNLWIREGDRR
jgi:N-methylhydantoinase A